MKLATRTQYALSIVLFRVLGIIFEIIYYFRNLLTLCFGSGEGIHYQFHRRVFLAYCARIISHLLSLIPLAVSKNGPWTAHELHVI